MTFIMTQLLIIIDMVTFSEEDIDRAITGATQKLGYRELRPNQELAVRHFLRGHDVFVSLPTGSGKAFDFLRQSVESSEQRETRLARRRVADRARFAARTAEQREARLHQLSTTAQQRLASDTPQWIFKPQS